MHRVFLLSLVLLVIGPLRAQIIISGFMSDLKGTDEPSKCSCNTVTHVGGHDYVQLMATVDIDFSKTPYSLVIANNGNAQAADWATGAGTGAGVTFKFDLTSGTANKGTFFYVGAAGRMSASYDACVTPSVSTGEGANWIRTIDGWKVNANGLQIRSSDLLLFPFLNLHIKSQFQVNTKTKHIRIRMLYSQQKQYYKYIRS